MRRALAPLVAVVLALAPTGVVHAATGPNVVGSYRYPIKPSWSGDDAAAVSDTGQYVAYVLAGKVYVRNFQSTAPRLVGTAGDDWVAISGNGRYVFHVNGNLRVVRWDRTTGSTKATGVVSTNPDVPPTVSNDGRFLWKAGTRYDLTAGTKLVVVPAATTSDDWGQDFSADMGPDGTQAAVVTTDPVAGADHCRIQLWSEAGGLTDTPVHRWCGELGQVWLRDAGSTVFFQVENGWSSVYRKLDVASGTVTTLAPPIPNAYKGGEDPVQNVHFSEAGDVMVFGLENYWACEPISCTQVRRWDMLTGTVTVVYRNWTNPDHKVITGYPVGINTSATQIAVQMGGWDRTSGGEKVRLGVWHP